MSYYEHKDSSLYQAFQDICPKVEPPMQFVSNLILAFEEDWKPFDNLESWAMQFGRWLPENTGLIRDPMDVNWNDFRVVDARLYSFALLRYS